MQRGCFFIRRTINISMVALITFIGIFKIIDWSYMGKVAVRESDFEKYGQYIIVEEAYHTGTGWEIIGDHNGYFNEKNIKDVIIRGILPDAAHPTAVNKFLCKVNYLGIKEFSPDGGKYNTYEILDWHPVYPVVRSRGFLSCFYSKGFLRKDEYLIY